MNIKNYKALIAGIISVVSLSANAAEKDGNFALGLGVGSTGGSINATLKLSDNWNLRGVYALYDDDFNETSSGINYDFNVDLDTFSLLFDWHPSTTGTFRVSVGAVSNNSDFSATARLTTATTNIGNSTFNSAQLGTINASVDYDSFAPYLGVGWGNAVKEGAGISFSADIGVMFWGDPTVNYSTTGTDPTIQTQVDDALAVEASQVQDDLDDFNFYPVLNIGFNYQF